LNSIDYFEEEAKKIATIDDLKKTVNYYSEKFGGDFTIDFIRWWAYYHNDEGLMGSIDAERFYDVVMAKYF
jgi:hypothetical protein